ncbi:MAG: DUF1416 domain-containing protein [Nocardioidaceae bacterium]|nr:DUF1416 domain-containing protein [Nocardioidaceae bacterium]
MSCAAGYGGASVAGVDVSRESIIEGVVVRDHQPVGGAYVRLLDRGGEFAAEVPTNDTGRFRFFAAPGSWTLRTLAPGVAAVDTRVTAARGDVAEVQVAV